MSAWIVEKATIDVLVNASARYGLISTGEEAQRLGQMLWRENHRSVNYRYKERTRTPHYAVETTEAEFDPVALLKQLDCYGYQTCERPDYPKSKAYDWVQRLREAVEKTLPATALRPVSRFGSTCPAYKASAAYDRAPWGIDTLDQMPLAS